MVDFNLYVYNVADSKLVSITTNGIKNIIYNAIPDWVYEGMLCVCLFVSLFVMMLFYRRDFGNQLCTMVGSRWN